MKSVSKDIVARSTLWTIWRTHIVRGKHRFEYNTVSPGNSCSRFSFDKIDNGAFVFNGIENKEDTTMRATIISVLEII